MFHNNFFVSFVLEIFHNSNKQILTPYHFKDGHHLPFFLPCFFFSVLLCALSSKGHLSSSRGMRDDYFDRRNHRKSVLPGECRPAEQVQGARSGEALSGGDVVDPGQSRGCAEDQSLGTRCNETRRSRPSSWTRVSASPGDRALNDAHHDLVSSSRSQSIGLSGRSGLCGTVG